MKQTYSSDSTIKHYYNSVKKFKLLTSEEENLISRDIISGSAVAKETLVKANLRLVIKIAKSFTSYDQSMSDLIQEGNIGLIHAADKFDMSQGCRFSTYASYWIKHYISRFIAKK